MAVEREITVRQVEDEPEEGFFQMTIEEGKARRQEKVPALYIEGGYEASQVHIQQQLETGVPVVAYRAGGRGMCGVAVNPNVVDVDHTRKIFRDRVKPKQWRWGNINPKESDPYFIDSVDNSAIEFTGTNRQTGEPIKITVGFVR